MTSEGGNREGYQGLKARRIGFGVSWEGDGKMCVCTCVCMISDLESSSLLFSLYML